MKFETFLHMLFFWLKGIILGVTCVFVKSRFHQIHFLSNLKPKACDGIYLHPVANEASGGRMLNTNRPQNNNQ